jgi:hypothetical protein
MMRIISIKIIYFMQCRIKVHTMIIFVIYLGLFHVRSEKNKLSNHMHSSSPNYQTEHNKYLLNRNNYFSL